MYSIIYYIVATYFARLFFNHRYKYVYVVCVSVYSSHKDSNPGEFEKIFACAIVHRYNIFMTIVGSNI